MVSDLLSEYLDAVLNSKRHIGYCIIIKNAGLVNDKGAKKHRKKLSYPQNYPLPVENFLVIIIVL